MKSINNQYPILRNAPYFLMLVFCQFNLFFQSTAQTQKGNDLLGTTGSNYFATSLSINANGNIIAVSEPSNGDSCTACGLTKIFEWQSTAWVQKGNAIAGDSAMDLSGAQVKLNNAGNVIAISSPPSNTAAVAAGLVRFYEFANNNWVQKGNAILGNSSIEHLGTGLDLSADGNSVAVGAPMNSDSGHYSGKVKVYDWINNSWTQRGLTIHGDTAEEKSGEVVSLSADGNTLAIGSPKCAQGGRGVGKVRVYEWSSNSWQQKGATFHGSILDEKLGTAISLSDDGSVLAIGSPKYSSTMGDGGKVDVYFWSNNSWQHRSPSIYGDGIDDELGSSIDLSANGTILAVGAPRNNDNGQNAGHLKVYEYNNLQWHQRGFDIDGNANSKFGLAVAIDSAGNTVIAGTYNFNFGQGHCKVYDFNYLVGINSRKNEPNKPTLAPNPSREKFNLTFKKAETGFLKIYDTQGKTVKSLEFNNRNHISLNMSNMPKNLYFIRISYKNGDSDQIKAILH